MGHWLSSLFLAVAGLLAGGLWWLHTRSASRAEPRDYRLGGAAESGTPAGGLTRRDRVEASALVPSAVSRGETFRLQVVLARRGQIGRALAALRTDGDGLDSARPRALSALLQRNSVLELTLDCADASAIIPRSRRLEWAGSPLSASFQLRPNANLRGDRLLVDVNVFMNRVCVGHLPLSLPVNDGPDRSPMQASAEFQVPRRIFMSYTSADRPDVLPIARALQRIGVDAFMDCLSLRGGERWEPRLYAEIDACDCFMLFWSSEAARSPWVERETLRAMDRQRASPGRQPKIVTHLLGKPPPAAHPPSLASLHFNDPAYVLWEAALAEADPPSEARV